MVKSREGTVGVLRETGRDAVLQRNTAQTPNPQRRRDTEIEETPSRETGKRH